MLYVSSYYCTCVLVLLYVCSYFYVSSYFYTLDATPPPVTNSGPRTAVDSCHELRELSESVANSCSIKAL